MARRFSFKELLEAAAKPHASLWTSDGRLSSPTGLAVGQVISVAGAVTNAIIANLVNTTVTLTANATATVAGAALAFVNPLFKTVGSVGA